MSRGRDGARLCFSTRENANQSGRKDCRLKFASHPPHPTHIIYPVVYLPGTRLIASSNYASTSDLAALAHRLDALESSLIKSGALLPADLERYLKGTREQMASFQPTPTYGAPTLPEKGPPLAEEETVDDTEGAALTLEHLAFGRSRVDGGHALPHFAMRYPSTVGRSAPNHDYHLAKTSSNQSPLGSSGTGISPGGVVHGGPGLGQDVTLKSSPLGIGQSNLSREERAKKIDKLLEVLGPTDVFDMLYRQTDVVLHALTKVLPTRERGEILVRAVSFPPISRMLMLIHSTLTAWIGCIDVGVVLGK